MRGRGLIGLAGALALGMLLTMGVARAAEADMPAGDGPSEDAAAILEAVSGIVEIQRDGEWFTGEEGAELALDDQVRTDADSFARLRFLDDDAESGAEPTILDLSPDSTVSIDELAIERDDEGTQRTGLIGVIRGAINAITKGWGSGSLFSVRAGTTVCGIRGSVANVGYDPDEDEATVTSLDGEMYTFEAKDRQEAFQRTRSAMRDLRRERRASFLEGLEPGDQVMRGRQGRKQRRKLAREQIQEARQAALESRRSGLARIRGRINEFAQVRPPAKRPGRLARKRIEKRIALRQDRRARRRPDGIGQRVKDRLQNGPPDGSLRDRLRDRFRNPTPANSQPANGSVRDRLRQPATPTQPKPGVQRRENRLDRRKQRIQRQLNRRRK